MESNLEWGFDALPKEIRLLIFSFTNLDLPTVLRAQAVSSEFKKLCWSWMREYDTSLLSNKENVSALVAQWVDRLTPTLITEIDFSRFDNVEEISPTIVHKFPHLRRIQFGGNVNIPNLSDQFCSHPELCEIFSEKHGLYDRTDPEDYFIRDYSLEYLPSDGQFTPLSPKVFNRKYIRGGIIDEKLLVIGADDGTLTFLTLDGSSHNDKLELHSTRHGIHKNSITSIWCEPEVLGGIISIALIASYDGVVSSWKCVDGAPALNQALILPEPIFFVCTIGPSCLLAAGKRTLYFCTVYSDKIIRKLAFKEDITGLFGHHNETVLSTVNHLYSINEDVTRVDVITKVHDTNSPNMWLSPDLSLRMTVREVKIEVTEYDALESQTPHQNFGGESFTGTFDPRPHVARFSPTRYWMTASTGPSITTYDLENKSQISVLSPNISARAKWLKLLPTCHSLWYTVCGNYLFGLFSNNTLYWWRIGYHY